ncbi:MAG: ABC transporter ATP-binding protein [Bacteroidales bacterium]
MSDIVIKLENISKQYRLGLVGTGTLSHDLNRWWAKIRGKEDPTAKVGARNVLDQVDSKYVWALKDINLEVKEGTVLGIVGKNGAGKSTLLKLLSRVTAPTTGEIKIKGRIASLLEVGTGFHPELTGRENIFLNGAILGMTKNEIKSKFDQIVEFSGVKKYIDTPVKRYSSGMHVRLAFAVAAHLDPEILIVDEVLAVGDAEFQRKAIGKMKDVSVSGRTVLFVSHNLTAVEQLCNRGALIENGRLSMTGDVREILSTYKKRSVETGVFKRYGAGNVTFESFMIQDSSGKETDQVELGQNLTVISKIHCSQNLDYTDLSLDIKSENNEFIGHVTSLDDDFEIKDMKAGDTMNVAIELCDIPFAPGTYYISLWLGNKYGTFDFLENCMRFQVLQGDSFLKRPYPFDKRAKVALRSNWKKP